MAAAAPPRRSRRPAAPHAVPSARLDRLLDLGGGVLLFPWLRRQVEGRALVAVEPPVATLLSVRVRRWAWPMPRRWGCEGEGPGQFDDPQGLAISSGGDIVVCDSGDDRVQVFRADGTFVREWGSFAQYWGRPSSVAVSLIDEVFVLDTRNHRIHVFRLDGSFVRDWGSYFYSPVGVAVHDDLVLVSDRIDHCIQCFGLDGTFVRMWGSEGGAPGQFDCPDGLAVSSAGEVFVCDSCNHRVQVFDLDGTFRRSWGSEGNMPGQFNDPHCVAVSPAGEVLVGDDTRVQVFEADGTFVRCLHLPDGADGSFWPRGLAVTPAGDVVVMDRRNKYIFIESAGS